MKRTPSYAVLVTVAITAVFSVRPAAQLPARGGDARGAVSIRALPGLPGGTDSSADSINNRGQIVGQASTASGAVHAVVWQHGGITDLGTLGGDYSIAQAINERGQIVGWSVTSAGELHAALWEDGRIIDLGTLGGDYSTATDINDHGQIAGSSATATGEQHAVLWEDGTMIDLGTLPSEGFAAASIAWAVNNRRQVVGVSTVTDGTQHAFLWEDGTMTDLGLLPGASFSSAIDINRHGRIVGVSDREGGAGPTSAVVWRQETGLRTLPGTDSFARAINDRGQIVGERDVAPDVFHAVLWQGRRRIIDLAPLPDGAFSRAWDINDKGIIVGESLTESFGSTAVVWTTRRLR